MKSKSDKSGMNTLAEPHIERVRSTPTTLMVDLADGRSLHLPLIWYPRLFRATQAQREHWELIGPGIGVHWPDVDEDLSAAGFLAGRPSIEYIREQRASGKRREKVAA